MLTQDSKQQRHCRLLLARPILDDEKEMILWQVPGISKRDGLHFYADEASFHRTDRIGLYAIHKRPWRREALIQKPKRFLLRSCNKIMFESKKVCSPM